MVRSSTFAYIYLILSIFYIYGERPAEDDQATQVKKENSIIERKNEDQNRGKLDCKEEMANKNTEIIKLKHEVAKLRGILVETFHLSDPLSGQSHLISRRESKSNPKVITAAKNGTAASTKSCISVSKFCTYPDQAISYLSTDSYIGINKKKLIS